MRKLPPSIVGHPMGAVKEQSANLYATRWPSGASSRCPLICRSGARAKARPATSCRRISMRRPSAQPSITLARGLRRPQPHRRDRHLRQRQLRHQRRQDRPAHEGDRDGEHVRHGRGEPERSAGIPRPSSSASRSSPRPPSSATPSSRAAKRNTPAARCTS